MMAASDDGDGLAITPCPPGLPFKKSEEEEEEEDASSEDVLDAMDEDSEVYDEDEDDDDDMEEDENDDAESDEEDDEDEDDEIPVAVPVSDGVNEEDGDADDDNHCNAKESSSSNHRQKKKKNKDTLPPSKSGISNNSNDDDSSGVGGAMAATKNDTITSSAGIKSPKSTPLATATTTHNTTSTTTTGQQSDNMMMMMMPSSSPSSSTTSSSSSPHPIPPPLGGIGGGVTTTTTATKNITHAHQKGGYQGMYRSAAAAHKHRQISIPPIGSPGLLMVPTLANTCSIYPPIATEADKEKWFVKLKNYNSDDNGKKEGEEGGGHEEEYILPSTVFRQSMIAGGYTYNAAAPSAEERQPPEEENATTMTTTTTATSIAAQSQSFIERGSSTERNVGDMFDSDAGGLYLHFPELIPCSLWKRRFGDNSNNHYYNNFEEEEWRKNEKLVEHGSRTATTANNNSNRGKNENGNQDEGEATTTATTTRGPKGARSSYIFFTNDQRPLMMAQFPGMRFTEQGIIMGERWRALTPEERRPYENMALEDKERYAREMKEYIASVVKKEEKEEGVREQQEQQQQQHVKSEDHDAEDEERGLKNSGEGDKNSPLRINLSKEERKGVSSSTCGEDKERAVGPSASDKSDEKGQRLVDAMILGLCKMLGENVNRRKVPTEDDGPKHTEPSYGVESKETDGTADVSGVPTAVATNDSAVNADCDPNNAIVAPSRPRQVSPPDLTVDELPRFTPHPSQPRTRPRPRPYAPLSFLDMIPISLTSSYPPSYVEKRRAYAQAVKDRERAIVEAQEAKDDYDDAQEKYVAHVEAWDRMLEYQKVQIARREAEGNREREEEILKQLGEDGVGTIIHRPTTPPPPEDPMDCMPPRPEPPGPARVVSIPNIPTPPSPPPVVEMEEDEAVMEVNGYHEMENNDGENSDIDAAKSSSSVPDVPMRVPKINRKLLQHLDPACFLPTMSGRYLGLLSNHISDPQFCGMLAPGIAGTTYGGGTGLATSYTGGGRGAMGLVSGPSRGGSMWQTPAGVGSSSKSSGTHTAGIEKRPLMKEKSVILSPLEVTSSSSTTVTAPAIAGLSSSSSEGNLLVREKDVPFSSPTSLSAEKRPPPSSDGILSGSDKKNKKQKRSPCLLTTGDRNTTATEIATGPAGPEFPDGWVVKTYRRSGGETIGKTDRFWFSPGRNIRFRARKHAVAFVKILNEEHVGGDEDKAAEIYRIRGLHF